MPPRAHEGDYRPSKQVGWTPSGGLRRPQLFIASEITSFAKFPCGSKTGDNIKQWFVDVISKGNLKKSSIIGITPDGAADRQCGLGKIEELAEKVDTCHLHRLQRAVLYSIGIAGKHTKNADSQSLLRQHSRTVQLTRQSGGVGKAVHDAQAAAGVPDHKILCTKKPSETRWGGHYLLLNANCLLRSALQVAVDDYKAANRNNEEAIVETHTGEDGSRAGKPVPAAVLGVTAEQWEDSLHLEGILKKCYDVKESLEHKGYLTGAQSMMMMHTLMKEAASIPILKFPVNLTVEARQTRMGEQLQVGSVCSLVQRAAVVLQDELKQRFFTWRPSNS